LSHLGCQLNLLDRKEIKIENIIKIKDKRKRNSRINRELDRLFSKVVRLRGKCEKCGNADNLQCSHVVPRGQSSLLRWNERNALCLDLKCHIYWWHKDILEAQKWFKETYPDNCKYLQKMRNIRKRWTFEEKLKLYESFLDRIHLY